MQKVTRYAYTLTAVLQYIALVFEISKGFYDSVPQSWLGHVLCWGDYKHWTQDPGPEDRGPKDPRTGDLRTRDQTI